MRVPLIFAALLLAGCTSIVWYGRSPDRRHRIKIVEDRSRQSVWIDGQPGPKFHGVAVRAMRFSPDGSRLAYPAQVGKKKWQLVVTSLTGKKHRRPGRSWEGIGEIAFGPRGRQLAYVASRAGRWQVVRAGRPEKAVDAVYRGTLVYRRDGRRLAYVARIGRFAHVVVDGRVGRAFHGVSGLTFGPEGKVIYVGRRGRSVRLVRGDVEGHEYSRITELIVRPRLAYVVVTDGKHRAVIGGRLGKAYEDIGGLTLDRSGTNFAYAAQRGRQALIVSRQGEGPLYDGIRTPTIAFTPAGKLIFVARRGTKYFVVVGGQAGPSWNEIDGPVLADKRWGYIGQRGKRFIPVVDGRRRGSYAWAGDLALSVTGKRYAFLARNRRGHMLAVYGRTHYFVDVAVVGTLVISRDGRHWACLVGDRKKRRLSIWIDGKHRCPFDFEELTAAVMRKPKAEASLLRSWVGAELRRFRATHRCQRSGPVK